MILDKVNFFLNPVKSVFFQNRSLSYISPIFLGKNCSSLYITIRGGARIFCKGGLSPPKNCTANTKRKIALKNIEVKNFTEWAEPTPGVITNCHQGRYTNSGIETTNDACFLFGN
jgi:hypothetical protein